MFSARRVVGLGVLTVALIGCGGAPAVTQDSAPAKDSATAQPSPLAKDSAPAKPSPLAKDSAPAQNSATTNPSAPATDSAETKPTGEIVQIGSVSYADWGHRDARDGKIRPLEAGDFFFKGTFIQGEPSQKLTLELENVADQVHNFSLPAQGLDRDIPPKGHPPMNVSVTFPESGELQFLCKYHTAQGMNGLLRVGGATPQSLASPSPITSPQPAR